MAGRRTPIVASEALTVTSLELYRWRYRDERSGKVIATRYLATEAEARERYGDRLIEAVLGSHEVREPNPAKNSTSAFRPLNQPTFALNIFAQYRNPACISLSS